jgi:hypothetical protein
VAELDLSKRGTTSRVVSDGLHDTLDVPVPFCTIERAELGSADSVLDMGLKNATITFTLGSVPMDRLRLVSRTAGRPLCAPFVPLSPPGFLPSVSPKTSSESWR